MKPLTIALALVVVLPGGNELSAQEQRPLAIEDALRIRTFFQSPPAFSPDGKWLAYTVTDNRTERVGIGIGSTGMLPTDIYVSNMETGASRNVSGNRSSNWLPVWSPSGHFLAFFSTRGGGGRRVWIWDSRRDTLTMVSDVEVRGDQIEWTPDSRDLVLAVLSQKNVPERQDERFRQGHKNAESGPAIAAPTATVFRSPGGAAGASEPWTLEAKRCDLVLVDVVSGENTTVLSNRKISYYQLSPDGSAIAYTDPVRFEQPGAQQILFDLITVPLATKQPRLVTASIRLEHDGAQFSWSPDAHALAFQTGGVLENDHDCYVIDISGGGLRNVTGLPRHSSTYRVAAPVWDQSGSHVYFTRDGILSRAAIDQESATELVEVPGLRTIQVASNERNQLWTSEDGKSTVVLAHDTRKKEDGFYRLDFTSGRLTKLIRTGQCYMCAMRSQHLVVSEDGRHFAFFAEDSNEDTDLWVSDTTMASPRRLTHLNRQFDNYLMGTSVLVNWLSGDGEALSGAVLLPSGYKKGQRYPTVVWVYGGANLSDNLHHFGLAYSGPFNMQLLATRGYVILLPDAPLRQGRPMLELAKTIVPGLNKLIDLGIADPARLGVMGHSYGGYSVLALIVETQRFKAAVEVAGFANLIGIYGEMDINGAAFGIALQEQGPIGGTPWQFRERYLENSPIFYLDRLDTPLLVMQGTDDETVAPFLADEIFVGLRRLEKPAEYVKYRGESHSPLYWSYPNQLDFCTRVIQWFERYLKTDRTLTSPSGN